MTLPEEIQKKIEQQSFNIAKAVFEFAKEEDLKDTSVYTAHLDGAEFGYGLAQDQIDLLSAKFEKQLLDAHEETERKEEERKQWADMCIKKQARIEELEGLIEKVKKLKSDAFDTESLFPLLQFISKLM